jgi:GNAT superfamily N-acetyltransferase
MEERDLIIRLERAEAESGFAMFAGTEALPGGLVMRRLGSVVARVDPAGRVSNVKGLGLQEEATEAAIDALPNVFRVVGKPFSIYLSPAARPEGLPQLLESKGYRRARSAAKVYRSTLQPVEAVRTGLHIREVSASDRDQVASVLAGGFRMPMETGQIVAQTIGKPEWRWFLGFDGEEAVSVGALFVFERAGWLGYGATLPSHRGRGGQSAIIAARLAAAAEAGCDYVTSETWEDTAEEPVSSYRNMIRNGFELLYVRPNFEYRFEG